MILLISVCNEKLHELEFVKPVEDILKNSGIKYFVKHYKDISDKDINKAIKIIISGTSLKDSQFIKDIKKFSWLKNFNKPVLGICSGMQIIGLIFGSELKNKREIGFYKENFIKEFIGLKDEREVYHLHSNYITLPKKFEKFTDSKIPQAIKHISKPIYGVLFHPEVRNKVLIEIFISNK